MKVIPMKRFIITFIFIMCLPSVSFAHQGRTDDAGGHHDYDNESNLGSYHYHHGYEAHLHTDGICPYDYDDTTGSSYAYSGNLYTPFYDSDDDINEVYNDGYDYGYESGYTDSKKETIPSLVAAFALPTVVASILTYRSNSKAHKEDRTIFQLKQQRYRLENDIKALKDAHETDCKYWEQKTAEYKRQAENAKLESEKQMRPHLSVIEARMHQEEEKIEELKQERTRLEEINNNLRKSVEEKANQKQSDLSRLIPKGTIINQNGYPAEINPTGYKGDKYYVVINHNSAVYHHPSCQHAWSYNKIHILDAEKTHRPCRMCKNRMPDMTWYHTYISLKDAEEKRKKE